jgi:hypothetical protein
VAVWSACEYSRQLSRRITLARRNKAAEGKRTGLKHGDAKQIKIVRWLYDQFANHQRSLCSLAAELNTQKVPSPTKGLWYVNTIARLLRRDAYKGDFSFNRQRAGQFFGIDDQGEVKETAELNGKPGKLYRMEGAYEPLVSPKLWDKANRRLELLGKDHGRRKRMGYALSGVLVCDHCASPLTGCRPHHGPTIYRCSAMGTRGKSVCGCRQVRESALLPFILRTLGEEISNLQAS